MNIALIGYGKMGQIIQSKAKAKGHNTPLIIDVTNPEDFNAIKMENIDVAIEFTRPEAAVDNIKKCVDLGIPIVSGTPGWMQYMPHVREYVTENNGSFFCASNYSLGVNIFFKLNSFLAKMMNHFEDYMPSIEEIHHTQKLDAPSGTAITLAEGILDHIDRKSDWVNEESEKEDALSIYSKRIPNVPGTHTISYRSAIDTIEMTHVAHNRDGFALGAITAAEFIKNKKGVFGMEELLKI